MQIGAPATAQSEVGKRRVQRLRGNSRGISAGRPSRVLSRWHDGGDDRPCCGGPLVACARVPRDGGSPERHASATVGTGLPSPRGSPWPIRRTADAAASIDQPDRGETAHRRSIVLQPNARSWINKPGNPLRRDTAQGVEGLVPGRSITRLLGHVPRAEASALSPRIPAAARAGRLPRSSVRRCGSLRPSRSGTSARDP